MIKIRHLKKQYDTRMVVDIEQLEIGHHRVMGIVGGNGSGKSTLLKMMASLETPTSGEIKCDISLSEMVYLFQKPHLFNTTVRHNIAYPLKFRKVPKAIIEKKVNDMVKIMGLSSIEHQNALKLSGGESQKVSLARALIFDPKWVLLDEPTANIDPKSTRQIENILSSLKMNMVLVTHNLGQAERLCDEVAVMSEGKIIEIDVPKIALKNELLTYV